MGLFDRFKKNHKVAQPTDAKSPIDKKLIDKKIDKNVDKKDNQNSVKPSASKASATKAPVAQAVGKAIGKMTGKATDQAVKKVKAATVDTSNTKQLAIEILLQPIVTEKASVSGAYYFKVKPTTNRNEVKKAFMALYGKNPRKVNIMNMSGKQVRFGKVSGKRNDWKKAIVYLSKGETVDVFSE